MYKVVTDVQEIPLEIINNPKVQQLSVLELLYQSKVFLSLGRSLLAFSLFSLDTGTRSFGSIELFNLRSFVGEPISVKSVSKYYMRSDR